MKPVLIAVATLAILGALIFLTTRRQVGPIIPSTTRAELPADTEANAAIEPAFDHARAEDDLPPRIPDQARAREVALDAINQILTATAEAGGMPTRPRVSTIRLEGAGPNRVDAVAILNDGARTYPITILLTRTPDGWRAVEQRP